MDWKPKTWKLNLKTGKDRWLVLLAVGLIFLILAFPVGEKDGEKKETDLAEVRLDDMSLDKADAEPAIQASAGAQLSYEQQLEQRLKDILSRVEGVGEVEVMIVLKSSEEKVWRIDRDTSYSNTKEKDQNGGTREIQSQEATEDTILTGQGSENGPILEKELKPEVGGVIVSAAGGGSTTVQAEISAAVEALFDVPSHKIKVLKRAE